MDMAAEVDKEGEQPQIDVEGVRCFRRAKARLNYRSKHRPDIAIASCSSAFDVEAANRRRASFQEGCCLICARISVGCSCCGSRRPRESRSTPTVLWGDKATRKSTCCVFVLHGIHPVCFASGTRSRHPSRKNGGCRAVWKACLTAPPLAA